ncbi:MAG: hypothetical protein DLM52_07075 [Chthoniobacterales bacterium]|nr:MAG: hypothetical protein DLM52_07075 [Chthoniobacterales bacterium]
MNHFAGSRSFTIDIDIQYGRAAFIGTHSGAEHFGLPHQITGYIVLHGNHGANGEMLVIEQSWRQRECCRHAHERKACDGFAQQGEQSLKHPKMLRKMCQAAMRNLARRNFSHTGTI